MPAQPASSRSAAPSASPAPARSAAEKNARVRRPHRDQIQMHVISLDRMLPVDHRTRLIWQFVDSLDLTEFYEQIKVSDSQAGHPAIDPRLLLALWLQGTIDGVISGREIARRCEHDIRYMWLCGDLSVNYHSVCDFRKDNGPKLERLFGDIITSLIDRGLLGMEDLGQDGMRVRASAGGSSFRRKPTLERLREEVTEYVEDLKRRREDDGESEGEGPDRPSGPKLRAAEDRQSRIAEALKVHAELSETREKRKKGDGEKTRVSTTDPEARRMKMGDGGTRPAYNVQLATDRTHRLIVGVDITNEGTDGRQLGPMLDQLQERYGRLPKRVLADSAFATKESVTDAGKRGVGVISNIPFADRILANGNDPYERRRDDTPEYVAFRKRMKEPQNKELYKERPGIAEFPNAECRNRGLNQFTVRGLAKTKAQTLIHALSFNLMRMWNLGWT